LYQKCAYRQEEITVKDKFMHLLSAYEL